MRDRDHGKMTRKEREREAHRREMLEAAERAFVSKGYHATTVEEIAQAAEFAVGTLYNFFKGKEDMYAQVVAKIAHDFMDLLEERALDQPDADTAIAALIKLRLTHFEEHRGFFRVFFETSPASRIDPARALPEGCVGLYDRYIEAVTTIFARGIRGGQFDHFDPLYLTLCLEGIINAFVAYWSRREPEEPLDVRVEKMQNAFLGRLRREPEAEKIGTPGRASNASSNGGVEPTTAEPVKQRNPTHNGHR
jgi:AcrR family transcriptional regulator